MPVTPRAATCVVGSQIAIRGALSGEEDLIVEGRLEGSISLAGHLVIAPGGVVEADVDVTTLEIYGELRGDVVAAEAITVEKGAVATGNFRAPRIAIHDGARFEGLVEMDVALPEGLARGR